jgi:methylmalonyl-CoA mutase
MEGDITTRHRRWRKLITALENDSEPELRAELLKAAEQTTVPALGITGTGGAGKSADR